MKKGNFQAAGTARALNIAPRSGVDDKSQHSVAHINGYQDEQKREGFSLSSAPGEIVIKNERPHMVGGVHEVIDNVHKDKTAFKGEVEGSVTE